MGKSKKERRESEAPEDDQEKTVNWDTLVERVSPIANPLASRKLTRKLYKVIRKGNMGDNKRKRRLCILSGSVRCG